MGVFRIRSKNHSSVSRGGGCGQVDPLLSASVSALGKWQWRQRGFMTCLRIHLLASCVGEQPDGCRNGLVLSISRHCGV